MRDVTIIGGGLAGLAAAVRLAPRGHRVTILESRPRLGGRASSFTDPATGQLVDACQHVSMGCCTEFAELAETIGVSKFLEKQPTLYFMTPNRRVSRFRRDPWPAPLHLGRALAGAHYLSASEKLRIAWGMACLLRATIRRCGRGWCITDSLRAASPASGAWCSPVRSTRASRIWV